jgi:hypothetical protein
VEAQPGVYCGEVSTRGEGGEYGPFTRFVVETKVRNATIAPANDPARGAILTRMIDARCRSDESLLGTPTPLRRSFAERFVV